MCEVIGAYRGPSPSRPVPISPPSLLSHPSHPAIKTCHVGDFPRRHLSEDLIHHQPSTGAPSSDTPGGRADVCSNDQHTLSCFSLSQCRPRDVLRALAAQTAYPVTSLRQEMWAGVHFFSLIRNIHASVWCNANPVGARSLQRQGHTPGRPRAIVGSRSSGAPGRPGPGTGGSSQDRLLRPRDRPHTTASRPHTLTHPASVADASAAAAREDP